ncbi:hypothetical protein RUM44_002538 [Polyplax serrata]|uniref:Activator of basal transcription 1 n=1 Tax=Polyplax serrata TaxID=468196 RepID=A0ABR1AF26_POLSC
MEVCIGDEQDSDIVKLKKKKPGIIYLGTLPPYMNVTKVKELFSQYGTLGRLFLQPAITKAGRTNKKKPPVHFSEGWVEFESKRVAKMVAETLNNTQIGGKKSSKFYDYTWNIKYLSGFKWIHLSERLAYEKAVRRQKLQAEIAQAKKEANFYAANLEKSKRAKKKSGNGKTFTNNFTQRVTENDEEDGETVKDNSDRKEFLKSLFGNS